MTTELPEGFFSNLIQNQFKRILTSDNTKEGMLEAIMGVMGNLVLAAKDTENQVDDYIAGKIKEFISANWDFIFDKLILMIGLKPNATCASVSDGGESQDVYSVPDDENPESIVGVVAIIQLVYFGWSLLQDWSKKRKENAV